MKTVHAKDSIKLVQSWMSDIDAKCREFLREVEAKENATASCRGCKKTGCCYQMVVIHLYEALPIAQRLRRDRRDTPELRLRLREAAEQMEKLDRTQYMNTCTPCVFLKGSRCVVYRDRPLACRTHYVFSDPDLCSPPSRGIRDILTLDVADFMRASAEFSAEFAYEQMGLKNLEEKIYTGVLPRVVLNVLIAWETEDMAASLRRMKWPSVEELQTKIDDLRNQGGNK